MLSQEEIIDIKKEVAVLFIIYVFLILLAASFGLSQL